MPDQWNPLRLTAEDRFPVPLATVLLAVFILGTLYVGLHHEPWRDEADVWLTSRDLPLSQMMPDWTAHAGTPIGWYLIVKTIVHSGLPYSALTIANLILIWAASAVLLLAATLTRLTKILLLASYFLAYEYAVIARTYALAVLLIFLAAAFFRTRETHPIRFAIPVALLFSVNVHGAILAGLLMIAATLRSKSANAIMVAGALFAFWQLHLPGGESNPLLARHADLNALTALRDVFVPSSVSLWTAWLSALILLLIGISLRASWRALFVFVVAIAALLALYSLVWFGGLRASGMILIAAIASIWIAGTVAITPASKAAAIGLNLTLIASAWFAFNMARTDVQFAFSGAKEMAAFIDHRFDQYDIAAHNIYQSEALLPWLPDRKFWYIGLGDYGTYLKWDPAMRRAADMPYELALTTARQHFAQTKRPWLLLLNRKMPQPELHGFRLVHATSVVVFRNLDERYWLYAPN